MSSPIPPPPDGDVIQSEGYMAGIITLTVAAVLIAWLRMYVRTFVSQNVGWDDYIMFAASLITIVTNAFLILGYKYGMGRHIYYVPHADLPKVFMWLWAGEPTNLFAVFLVRLSICLFFIRLVPPQKKIYAWTIWVLIALLTASAVFTSVYYFFECRPIEKVWRPKEVKGKCFSEGVQEAATWLYQATSIIGDLVLLLIPVTLFWRLNVRLRTKIGLIVICSLGIFTNICAIVKTILLPNLFSKDPDKTWIVKDLALWAPMELCIGMICGSIPALANLFGLGAKEPNSHSSSSRYNSKQRYYRRFGGTSSTNNTTNSHELSTANYSRPQPTTAPGIGAGAVGDKERSVLGIGRGAGPSTGGTRKGRDREGSEEGILEEGMAYGLGYGAGIVGDATPPPGVYLRDEPPSLEPNRSPRHLPDQWGFGGIRQTNEVEVTHEAVGRFAVVGGDEEGGVEKEKERGPKAYRWNVI